MRGLVWVLLVLTFCGCDRSPPTPQGFQVAEVLGGVDAEGFARATAVRRFRFPQDHGPHPAYRNEWWYLTGHLRAGDGREFGFQATFFRIALTPQAISSDSAWRSNQVWMAHAALSDIADGQHLAYERFARQAVGLAGAQLSPVRVWLEDWRLQRDEHADSWRLQLPTEGFDLSLQLAPASPVILQGDQGLSRKSAEPGNASYYYSIPRLQATGQLHLKGKSLAVQGLAWLDREWSTSALGPGQAGWDWFSLQLADGRNLMYYQLRRQDGGTDPHSSGSLSDAAGLQRRLDPTQVKLTPLATWRAGDRRYPVEWRLQLLNEPHPWRVRALLADQEMRLSVRYWEGMVEVLDDVSGKTLGHGYLEMTGAGR
jgi:predicted secreted hydrolase